jgi:very-short-patch-repair endonuclease
MTEARAISSSSLSLDGRGWGEGELTKRTERARRLRKDSTDAEKRLWSLLRAHRYGGYKFKRQQPIGPYIVDFACFDARLVIEIDGGQHADAARSDSIRDAWLAREGFRILRFWNNEVLGNIEGVMQQITLSLQAPSPQPSPTRGEGEPSAPRKIRS